jgi:hypothetical protein
MKHGKRPTVEQCKTIKAFKYKAVHLNPANWLIVKNLPDKLVIVHRERLTILEVPVEVKVSADNINGTSNTSNSASADCSLRSYRNYLYSL